MFNFSSSIYELFGTFFGKFEGSKLSLSSLILTTIISSWLSKSAESTSLSSQITSWQFSGVISLSELSVSVSKLSKPDSRSHYSLLSSNIRILAASSSVYLFLGVSTVYLQFVFKSSKKSLLEISLKNVCKKSIII